MDIAQIDSFSPATIHAADISGEHHLPATVHADAADGHRADTSDGYPSFFTYDGASSLSDPRPFISPFFADSRKIRKAR